MSSAERNTQPYLFSIHVARMAIWVNIIQLFVTTALVGLLIWLFPLKQVEPYFLGIDDVSKKVVTITRLQDIREESRYTVIMRSALQQYIYARETITDNVPADTRRRYIMTQKQSNSKTRTIFENALNSENHPRNIDGFTRSVVFNNDGIKEHEEYQAFDNIQHIVETWRFRVDMTDTHRKTDAIRTKTVQYEVVISGVLLIQQNIPTKDRLANPLGLLVQGYSITEIN